MAVAIVVEEGASSAPAALLLIEAGLFGDVGEGAVAVVVEENVAAPESAKDVVPAVIVVVADADAGLPATAADAGFLGDLSDCAITVVLVEMGGGLFSGRPVFVDAVAVGEIDVEPAVVVVVEEGDAAAFGFDDDALVFHAAPDVGRVEAGGVGDIDELDRRRRL